MRSHSALVLTVVGLALAASTAQADDIRVRPGRNGLRRALERAQPGDRLILRGVVRDDVTVNVPGITIDGGARGSFRGRVAVEASGVTIRRAKFKSTAVRVTGDDVEIAASQLVATPVTVEGDGASIVGNDIAPGFGVGEAVLVVGDGARVADNDVSEFTGGVHVSGAGAVVSGNSFEGGDVAVVVVGDDASVAGNVTDSAAEIVVTGDRATLSSNELLGPASVTGDDASIVTNRIVSGETALSVSGDRAELTGNTLTSGGGGAIVEGDGANISDNVVHVPMFGEGAGIAAVGDGAVISGNDVTVERTWPDGSSGSSVEFDLVSSGNDGIAVFGGGNRVEDNDVAGQFGGGAAVRVQGDENAVDSNVVHDVHEAYAVVLIGDDNTATSNDVSDVEGEGVIVQGEDGVVTDTHVSGVSSCGFLLIGNTRLDGCTATDCAMGVVNLAGVSKIVDTTVSGNAPYDLVDLGGATVLGGSIGWTAKDPASFPDFLPLMSQGFVPAPAPKVTLGAPGTFAW